jgi:hypothetical protein
VLLAGMLLGALQPRGIFVAAGALLALALIGALSQPEWRAFGSSIRATSSDARLTTE